MIVQLTGTLLEVLPTRVVIDVGGVGYELGVSAITAQSLPQVGSSGVTVLTRMIVREDAQELYGFATREERALFDRLRAISGVGPKLALATLSTFTPVQLATVVATQDVGLMATVPGVGRKKASRLLVELSDVFSKDMELRGLVGLQEPLPTGKPAATPSIATEATEALLAMGLTPQEADLALEGAQEAGIASVEQAVTYALRRLGGNS